MKILKVNMEKPILHRNHEMQQNIMMGQNIRCVRHVLYRSEGVLWSIIDGDQTENDLGPRRRPRQRWADRIKNDLRVIVVENAVTGSVKGNLYIKQILKLNFQIFFIEKLN